MSAPRRRPDRVDALVRARGGFPPRAPPSRSPPGPTRHGHTRVPVEEGGHRLALDRDARPEGVVRPARADLLGGEPLDGAAERVCSGHVDERAGRRRVARQRRVRHTLDEVRQAVEERGHRLARDGLARSVGVVWPAGADALLGQPLDGAAERVRCRDVGEDAGGSRVAGRDRLVGLRSVQEGGHRLAGHGAERTERAVGVPRRHVRLVHPPDVLGEGVAQADVPCRVLHHDQVGVGVAVRAERVPGADVRHGGVHDEAGVQQETRDERVRAVTGRQGAPQLTALDPPGGQVLGEGRVLLDVSDGREVVRPALREDVQGGVVTEGGDTRVGPLVVHRREGLRGRTGEGATQVARRDRAAGRAVRVRRGGRREAAAAAVDIVRGLGRRGRAQCGDERQRGCTRQQRPWNSHHRSVLPVAPVGRRPAHASQEGCPWAGHSADGGLPVC